MMGSRLLPVYPNLYILIAARSGTGKSTVINRLMRPLLKYEATKKRHFDTTTGPRAQADLDALEEELKRLLHPGKHGDPAATAARRAAMYAERIKHRRALVAPIFHVEDTTTEALVLTLADQKEFAFSVSACAATYPKSGMVDTIATVPISIST